jgi:uncharacterized protein DUF2779
MSMIQRYLTKSRFKLANECPTKLFYTAKMEVYHDTGLNAEFLAALAEGGHQVGAYAQALLPDGHLINTLDYEESLTQTAALLKQQNVTIFEPAFRHDNIFIRVDILEKRGNNIRLIEVKAKSCRGGGEAQFLAKKTGKPTSDWASYLEDAAFQHYVLSQAHPDWRISVELMLVDKARSCPSDGLHQKFLLQRDAKGRSQCIQTAPLTKEELDSPLLTAIPVVETLRIIYEENRFGAGEQYEFSGLIEHLAEKYAADERIKPVPGGHCKNCQFRANDEQRAAGLRSGFGECWTHSFKLSPEQLRAEPTILELWNYRKKAALFNESRVLFSALTEANFDFPRITSGEMKTKERQWLQVQLSQGARGGRELRPALKQVMPGWTYPLHCIDFETMQPAIPMHAGSRPYEQIAFQFSYHTLDEDGTVTHAGEWIEDRRGAFPNFEFVRALKAELEGDAGTIFRYAPHENTILCAIRRQLIRARDRQPDVANAADAPDADELIAFIESITQPPSSGPDAGAWPAGPRNMVDLCELVKQYYLDARMGGSNSIKQVLPAVLNRSKFLREKYSEPIYCAGGGGIASLNFTDQVWVSPDSHGEIRDPYKLLPNLFEGFDAGDVELLLSREGSIDNGGAAMTTYARMQFSEMSPAEREHLRGLLLKYCELDTLAMVMIVEAWREWLDPMRPCA